MASGENSQELTTTCLKSVMLRCSPVVITGVLRVGIALATIRNHDITTREPPGRQALGSRDSSPTPKVFERPT